MTQFIIPLWTSLWLLVILYAIAVSTFLLLENRSPQSTLAWLLLFFALPLLGLIIYLLFGRDYRAFSRHDQLLRQELNSTLLSEHYVIELLAGQKKEIHHLKQAGPLVYRRVLELMRRNAVSPLFPYNQLEILRDGAQKYPRLLADLKAARHSIHMEYFEWSSDALMQEFKQVLLERAKAGVQVRVLYDPLGCLLMLNPRYVKEMNEGGVRMLPWSPLYHLHTISYRSHRKIVVIDSCIGYTGGINMTEEYLRGPKSSRFSRWRDTHVRVTGQVVLGLQISFAVQWHNTTSEHLTDPAYYLPPSEPPGYLPLQVVTSGPDAEWKAIRRVYFALITAAQAHIYIQSPYLVLDEGLAEAIANAAASGVDVRVMTAPDGPGGAFPYWAGFTYAANMAKAGVKVYLYQGGYLHAKTIMVDSKICSIGSTNMDIRSFDINYELNLIVYDEKVTRDLEQDFDLDLQQCAEFDVEAYQRSSLLTRTRDSFFRLLAPLL